ncbi:unnamed protein product, partial [Ixodes hexagonus]
MARFVLAVALAVTLNPACTLADIKIKAVFTPCDSHAYEPMAFHNSITNCQKKIQISLLVNNTALGKKSSSYVHVTEVYEPELDTTSRLFNTMVLRLRQEDMLLAYPLRYIATVNGRVTETYRPEKSCNLSSCAGDIRSKRPPRGYCCNCESGGNCTVHCLEYSKLWYFVCVLGPPVIKQDTFIQLFVQKEHPTLPQRWQPFMNLPEELVVSAEHPLDFNSANTVSASYLSEKAPRMAFVLKNYKTMRVLIPYPNPGVPMKQMSSVFIGGSDNIMLIPNNMTKSSDVLKCINDLSLLNLTNHCHPMNKRCFEGEPYDIFLREE